MKIITMIILSLSMILTAETLTLEECRSEVKMNFPLYGTKAALGNSFELKSRNIRTNYYPKMTFSAQATYQTDVTKFPLEFPSSPLFTIKTPEDPDKDRYQFQLDVKQLIYDGGLIKSQIRSERDSFRGDSLSVESELYKLNGTVDDLYFGILLLQEKEKTLRISLEDLKSKEKTVESGVKNGVMLQTNLLVLKAGILDIEQQISETEVLKNSNIKILAGLMKKEIGAGAEFILPEAEISETTNGRIELQSLMNEEHRLDNAAGAADAKLMPRLYGFAQAGYSKPGLNMFSNEFDTYGIFGVKAEFEISNFYTHSREKDIIKNSKQIIADKKDAFTKSLGIQLDMTKAEISNYSTLLEKDGELIAIREEILKTAEKQLDHGVINVAEYIDRSTELNLARQAQKSHEIQLARSKVKYNNLLNR